jgi:hypothetical protein
MKKFFIIIGSVLLALIVAGFFYFFVGKSKPVERIDFGVTFSKIYAEELGLDWEESFLAALDDLKVKRLRLVAYWPEIEPNQWNFDFKDLDWQIDEAEQRGAEIILAVGRRLPRWPECHVPEWAKGLSENEQQEKVLTVISEVIQHYKNEEAIKFWQIENEPFLGTFGQCPKLDKEFLDKEIALARSLDSRPIIITESGEFSTWIGAARRADIVGTTLYRKVHGKLGYIRYPIPAIFYSRKAALIKKFFDIDKIIIVELAAEPWGVEQTRELSLEEQLELMNAEEFASSIDYARRTGFSEAYLWGAEWWYWLKTKYNNESMWEEAKKLF